MLKISIRKIPLTTGEVYHVFTRSIADFKIFNNKHDYTRAQHLIKYYKFNNDLRFSKFIELKTCQQNGFNSALNIMSKDKEELIQIVAYCLMPTHIHLILKQLQENGISKYMNNVLNGYSKYFNTKHKRKGPLWESRFNSILVDSDEQLLHLTRYIHLNPATAKLVDRPGDWIFSSYGEYLSKTDGVTSICKFDDILEIDSSSYRKFVNDHISYQRELAKIKNLIIE